MLLYLYNNVIIKILDEMSAYALVFWYSYTIKILYRWCKNPKKTFSRHFKNVSHALEIILVENSRLYIFFTFLWMSFLNFNFLYLA